MTRAPSEKPMRVIGRTPSWRCMRTSARIIPADLALSRAFDQGLSMRYPSLVNTAAQQTMEALEVKVGSLEDLVRASEAAKAAEDAKIAEREAQLEKERQNTLSALFAEFQKRIEIQWDSVKSEWDAEREKMDKAKAEMESRLKGMEDGLNGSATKLDVELTTFGAQLAKLGSSVYGGGKGNGLVTPPSPARSLSPDSDRRRKRSPRRGRSRPRSASPSTTLVDGSGSSNGTRPSPPVSINSRSSSPSTGSIAPLTDSESITHENAFPSSQYLPTPESSVMKRKIEDVGSAQKQAQALVCCRCSLLAFNLPFYRTSIAQWRSGQSLLV